MRIEICQKMEILQQSSINPHLSSPSRYLLDNLASAIERTRRRQEGTQTMVTWQ